MTHDEGIQIAGAVTMPNNTHEYATSSAHFTRKELACRCGCGDSAMRVETLRRLEELRTLLGERLTLSSAKRCANHNRSVSSTGSNGPHTTGAAIDIKCHRAKASRIMHAAFMCGFTGIGVSQKGSTRSRFIHLDDLPDRPGQPRPTIWSY